jgi:hypothetical protein
MRNAYLVLSCFLQKKPFSVMQILKQIRIGGLLWGILFNACQSQAPVSDGPEGFDWQHPQKSFLRENLNEVSGIAFGPGNDTALFAVNDEEGRLYNISLAQTKLKLPHMKIANDGDYEDLAWWKGNLWVLRSNGHLLKLGSVRDSTIEYEGILPEAEYEALASRDDNLYVACKVCKDKGNALVHQLVADSLGRPVLKASFTIREDSVLARLGKDKVKLHPSAMAWHAPSQQWLILSANDRLILTTTADFRLLGAWALPSRIFPQPEGIAVSPEGHLYITNEGAESTATLLQFTYAAGAAK